VSGATIAVAPDALVRCWVDGFHARDVEGMLARLDSEVRFHPLRLSGLDGSYRGHDGVQRWFARLTQLHHDYVIAWSEVYGSGDDKVLAVGELRLAGNPEIVFLRTAPDRRRRDRGGESLIQRSRHAGTPRLDFMTHRSGDAPAHHKSVPRTLRPGARALCKTGNR
jgi:SnoaL-like domain